MLGSVGLVSGLLSVSGVPGGKAANASLVGAKTVNGPALFNVSTSPAALTAATSVVWSAGLTALSTMSLLGYIACPPTMTGLPAPNPLNVAIASVASPQIITHFTSASEPT